VLVFRFPVKRIVFKVFRLDEFTGLAVLLRVRFDVIVLEELSDDIEQGRGCLFLNTDFLTRLVLDNLVMLGVK